jgi:hypothetical protein
MNITSISARISSPKLPRSRTDPVMAAKLIKKSFGLIKKKYAGIEKDVISLFNEIPVSKIDVNAEKIVERTVTKSTNPNDYFYDVDASRLALINVRLMEILDEWLLDGHELNVLWSGKIVEDAYLSGTGLAQSNLSSMSATYAKDRTLTYILLSESYRRRVGIAYANSYSNWKGLSDWSRNDLAKIISEAVAAGRNPKTVITLLSERLAISRSHAENIAQTEITGALRQARWDEAEETQKELGLNTSLLWISALIPTTRVSHAARHNLFYDIDNVRDFYSRDGNRRKCLCSQIEVILINGKAEITKSANDLLQKEKENWNKKYLIKD